MNHSAIILKRLSSFFIAAMLYSPGAFAYCQRRPPRSEDYPVHRNEIFKGKPARVVLDSRRARMFKTVLRKGAREGPNFAGHYTIVTWGAGLGAFSMAVDAKTRQVHFPPFESVQDSYGLPYVDKANNPAWRITSKLFAFVGELENQSNRGEGMYLYVFDRDRFRLVRFIKNDEDGRRELGLKP
jgi:hypothetical protein